MGDESSARFDFAAEAYDEYLSSPLGKLRYELTWHWLARALHDQPRSLNVIDVGCGPGHIALRLAETGHKVCLLDPSSNMLALARARAEKLPQAAQARLTYCQVALEETVNLEPCASFDLALAHTVLEYLPNPSTALSLLSRLLRPHGLLSVVFANRDAEPLRRALAKRQCDDVRTALTANIFPEELFGLQRRTFTPAWMRAQLQMMGMAVIAERGIRVFADYITSGENERNDLAAIYDLELAAADLFPWKYIARYVHTLSRK